MSTIATEIFKAHNGTALTGAGAGTSTSEYFPCDTSAELCVWIEQDSAGTPGVDVTLRYSPHAADYMNGITPTTDDYVSVTVIAGFAVKVLTRYTPIEVAALGYPPKSCAVHLVESGTDNTTVYVWVEKRG